MDSRQPLLVVVSTVSGLQLPRWHNDDSMCKPGGKVCQNLGISTLRNFLVFSQLRKPGTSQNRKEKAALRLVDAKSLDAAFAATTSAPAALISANKNVLRQPPPAFRVKIVKPSIDSTGLLRKRWCEVLYYVQHVTCTNTPGTFFKPCSIQKSWQHPVGGADV